MKVLGIMGSPRLGGNSDILLDQALAGARDAEADVEKIVLYQKKISGCLNCEACNDTGTCAIKDDMAEIQQKILEADAIIHSGPLYYWAMTSQMKAYLERWCVFCDAEWKVHKTYANRIGGKRIGLIAVCGDLNVSAAEPIVRSFKNTCLDMGLTWLGAVQVSAAAKGEVAQNKTAMKEAYQLGKTSAARN
jgi:multimeric flavodoxin WrbA